MTSEKDILKDMLISEEDSIANLASIVKKAKEVFGIENKTGKVIFKDYSKLKNHQKILVLLIGRYFSMRLNII
jgi:hypothetical protein